VDVATGGSSNPQFPYEGLFDAMAISLQAITLKWTD